jgi:Crp-like helix-turn-helix domain
VLLTQEDLAGLAGTTRPSANKALRAIEKVGLSAMARGEIRLLEPEGLVRYDASQPADVPPPSATGCPAAHQILSDPYMESVGPLHRPQYASGELLPMPAL